MPTGCTEHVDRATMTDLSLLSLTGNIDNNAVPHTESVKSVRSTQKLQKKVRTPKK